MLGGPFRAEQWEDRPQETIPELKARADLATIAARYTELKPKSPGDLWGRCPFHAERSASFHVLVDRQRFKCFGCNAGGDVIDFLQAVEGLDRVAAIRRLREIVDGCDVPAVPRISMAQLEAQAAAEAARKRELARRIWSESKMITDCLPSRYLRERRGIRYWQSTLLRWHPECPWEKGKAGCIVAPVHDLDGDVVGVWRIKPALEGKVERKGLGTMKGCSSRLFPGKGGRLAVTEGVEDALAAHLLTEGWPAWAALSAGNMGELELPPQYRELMILADADPAGIEAGKKLAARMMAEGRHVTLGAPSQGKDANDVLRGETSHG